MDTPEKKKPQLFYSPLQKGFYRDDIHANQLPPDRIAITEEKHHELLEGLSVGKTMAVDDQGTLILLDHVPAQPSARVMRAKRDGILTATDNIISRHIDQREMNRITTLSLSQYQDVLNYRQALRDMPQRAGFPNVSFPVDPLA